MDSELRLTGDPWRRVYRLPIDHGLTVLCFFVVGFGLVGALAPLLAGVPRLDPLAAAFLALLLAALGGGLGAGGLIFLSHLHARLVLTPREIIYHGVGYTLRAAWADAAAVTVAPFGPRPVRGLRLRRATLDMSPWLRRGPLAPFARALLALLTGQPAPPADGPVAYHAFVPVGLFAGSTAQLDVWDEIELHAPHLFDAEEPLHVTVRRLRGQTAPPAQV